MNNLKQLFTLQFLQCSWREDTSTEKVEEPEKIVPEPVGSEYPQDHLYAMNEQLPTESIFYHKTLL